MKKDIAFCAVILICFTSIITLYLKIYNLEKRFENTANNCVSASGIETAPKPQGIPVEMNSNIEPGSDPEIYTEDKDSEDTSVENAKIVDFNPTKALIEDKTGNLQ